MNISSEEIEALKYIHERSNDVSSEILVSLKNKKLITGLLDVSTLSKEAYIVGMDTELTNQGLEFIK